MDSLSFLGFCATLAVPAYFVVSFVMKIFGIVLTKPAAPAVSAMPLEALIANVEATTGFQPRQRPGSLDATALEGTVASGRKAEVRFTGGSDDRASYAFLGVEADKAPRLLIRRLVDADLPEFDDRLVLVGGKGERARAETALRGPLLATVRKLFARSGVERLEIERGKIGIFARADRLPVNAYHDLLECLDAVAVELDRVPLEVHVLGGVRQALGCAGSPRCAYCHDAVTGAEPDLVACAICSTVLHEACWSEHGRCPVLGCEGREPERARTA